MIHEQTLATLQITGLKALAQAADKVTAHDHLCFNAGSTLNLAQVAWAELDLDQYRFCITR
ncbi:MAG: hypothetical protein OSA51_10935 [Octadecabacter sp.]|nr:hypothetical protein [Octadecabacter sp.]